MRSTILALLAVSTAVVIAACGDSTPPPKPPTNDTPPAADADAGSTSSSGGATSSSGGATSTADAGSGTAAASSGATPPAPAGFDSLSMDKKTEVMMTQVVPKVGKAFKEHDAKKFDKFGCKTCHGDAKTKTKDDPKKVLPKLVFKDGGFEKLQKSKPAMMKFMGEKVVPLMAEALGEKPYDPATKQGFGCGGCHTVEM